MTSVLRRPRSQVVGLVPGRHESTRSTVARRVYDLEECSHHLRHRHDSRCRVAPGRVRPGTGSSNSAPAGSRRPASQASECTTASRSAIGAPGSSRMQKRTRGGCVTGRRVVGPVVVSPAARTGTGPPNRAVMLPVARVVRAELTGQPDTDVLERATSALQARRGVQDEAGTRPGAVVHDALHQMITLVSGLDR